MRHLLLLTGCIFFIQGSLSQEEETDETPLEQMSGKQIYATFCSRCHGDDGRGDVPRELIENMEVEPPDLTEPYFSSREKRKDWRAVVAHGGGARGLSMAMPAWGEALSELQIHETIEYIKSFVDQERYPQGELNFVRGHTTTKAFVEQEALLIPT
jgi:mono/diheme cytochrome c family protein